MYTKLYTHKLFILKMVVIFLILTSVTLATESCQEQEPAYAKEDLTLSQRAVKN